MAFRLYLLSMPEDLVVLVVCSLAQDHGVSPETISGWATGAAQHPAGEATLAITKEPVQVVTKFRISSILAVRTKLGLLGEPLDERTYF